MKKIVVALVFLFFSRLEALSITDLVQTIHVDKPNRQIHFDLTNRGEKPVNLDVEVRKSEVDKNGTMIEGPEVGEDTVWAVIPEAITVQPNSTAVVTAQYLGDVPEEEVRYLIGFRSVQLPDQNQNKGKSKKTGLGVRLNQVTYAAVYIVTEDMKPNVSVEYIGDGKIAARNTGNRSVNIGNVSGEVTIKGKKWKIRDVVETPDVAVHPGTRRVFKIKGMKEETKKEASQKTKVLQKTKTEVLKKKKAPKKHKTKRLPALVEA